MKKIISFLFSIFILLNSNGQVLINEYCASNNSNYADNYGNFEDWFELYNNSTNPVDLTGWYLSDKPTDIIKYQISSGTIPAGGRIMVVCSGRDEFTGGIIHTSFKLTQTKPEEILISDPNGVVIDQVQILPCQLNHSRGRTSDGSNYWSLFTNSSPNGPNSNSSLEYAATPIFDLDPGYHSGTISLNITCPDFNTNVHYTTDGSIPNATSNIANGAISVNTNKVIRAIAISSDPNIPNSFIETNTYFINTTHTIAIISICGDEITDFINDDLSNAFTDNFNGAIEYFASTGVLIDEGTGD